MPCAAKLITITFGAKNDHYQSKEFVCNRGGGEGAYANNLADAVDLLLMMEVLLVLSNCLRARKLIERATCFFFHCLAIMSF